MIIVFSSQVVWPQSSAETKPMQVLAVTSPGPELRP